MFLADYKCYCVSYWQIHTVLIAPTKGWKFKLFLIYSSGHTEEGRRAALDRNQGNEKEKDQDPKKGHESQGHGLETEKRKGDRLTGHGIESGHGPGIGEGRMTRDDHDLGTGGESCGGWRKMSPFHADPSFFLTR